MASAELDGARCKFEEYREGPARGRLEALLHEWVGANPVSGYRQALNSVTAVVLHVVGDDELLARGVLQAITDKYMCGQLARGALQKVCVVGARVDGCCLTGAVPACIAD